MARLTVAQKRFLSQYDVPLSRVFDANGLRKSEYHAAMKQLDMLVAYGVTPCSKAGHTLRTRSGHCAQCDAKNLAFLRRHHEDGEVYLARSRQTGLVKIGSSIKPSVRVKNLNGYFYGGTDDWEIHCSYFTSHAARIECDAQRKLANYRLTRVYYFDGRQIECNELFECRVETALRALRAVLPR